MGWEDPLEKGKATHSSSLKNSMDYIAHGVAKSQTQLNDFHFTPLLEVLAEAIRQEKESIQIEREEVNLLLSADDMILYIGIPEVFTLKL